MLRALLRAAGAELAMTDGPPAKVVINEYLDIARGFFTGPEPGLANAVLDRMARGCGRRSSETGPLQSVMTGGGIAGGLNHAIKQRA